MTPSPTLSLSTPPHPFQRKGPRSSQRSARMHTHLRLSRVQEQHRAVGSAALVRREQPPPHVGQEHRARAGAAQGAARAAGGAAAATDHAAGRACRLSSSSSPGQAASADSTRWASRSAVSGLYCRRGGGRRAGGGRQPQRVGTVRLVQEASLGLSLMPPAWATSPHRPPYPQKPAPPKTLTRMRLRVSSMNCGSSCR